MNPQPYSRPPRWWSPLLSRFWFWLWTPIRRYVQFRGQRIDKIEIRGLEHLQTAINEKKGILIAPNHSGHADPVALYRAAEKVKTPFYFMCAWQVLAMSNPFRRLLLRQHGCFSIDREGRDLKAYRQAVDILSGQANPLVIFPEGEVYHTNDQVTPFNDGPVAMAMTAAKQSDREIVCIPCAIKYQYTEDPTAELEDLMDRLEKRLSLRHRDELTLEDRIYRFAEAILSVKEVEYLGRTRGGSLPERIDVLADTILRGMEEKYSLQLKGNVPTRVKVLRRKAIEKQESADVESAEFREVRNDLWDLNLVTQLYSYPGDYVSAKPSIERLAETLDKLEEDVFQVLTASIRARRKIVVVFGEPVEVKNTKDKNAIHQLTERIEHDVQQMINKIEDYGQRTSPDTISEAKCMSM